MADELELHPAVGHLVVLRATLRAALEEIDAAIALFLVAAPEPASAATCTHDERELVSSMGEKPRYRCQACGAEFAEEAAW